jgi:tellurite resistance protein
MPDSDAVIQLPEAEPARLAQAVQAAVNARASSIAWIREGAKQSAAEDWTAEQAARRFQTLLEIGYLVASADGFAAEERASLAQVLEKITNEALDHGALEQHFEDLEDTVASLGRRERLARAAADLEDEATAEEAIGLVSIIALADGVLSQAEHAVLLELAHHLKLEPGRVHSVVKDAADSVKGGLQ